MTDPIQAGAATPPASPDAKLRKVSQQMEGVFVQQLFKAMRETVPEGGMFDGGQGEEMFSGLLDEHLAEEVPGQWQHGIGSALYHQLRGALPADGGAASPTHVPGGES